MLNIDEENKFLKIVLWIIVLSVAITVRFWNIGDMHFSNDELSALNRISYDSVSSVIEKGVMPDGHPLLVQIFLYYYVPLVGADDLLIKLPFLLLGVFSVILAYFVGKTVSGNYAGLSLMAFVAVVQPFVYFSQLSRPYSPALFFVLVVVYAVTKIIYEGKNKISLYLLFAVGLLLTGYTHYIAFLTVLFFSFFAFWFIPKEQKIKFIAYFTAAILFWLPHLPITLEQLSHKGLAWLAAPDKLLLENIFLYYFNYNIVLLAVPVTMFLFSTVKYFRFKEVFKNSVLFFLPFLFTFLTVYFYSIYRMPILQFSVMIFPFALFFIFLFYPIKYYDVKFKITFVFVILLCGLYSLVLGRNHFKVAYSSSFYQVAGFYKKYASPNVPLFTVSNGKFYVQYYLQNESKNRVVNFLPDVRDEELLAVLDTLKTDSVVFGLNAGMGKLYLMSYIKEKYPYVNDCSVKAYLLSKSPGGKKCENLPIDTLTGYTFEFNKKDTLWKGFSEGTVFYDSTEEKQYILRETEWGVNFEIPLDSLIREKSNVVIYLAKIEALDDSVVVDAVIDVKSADGKQVWWNSTTPGLIDRGEKRLLAIGFYPYDVKLVGREKFKAYIWNKKKKKIKVLGYKVVVLRGEEEPYMIYYPVGF